MSSILDGAAAPQAEPIIITICGHPGSGKTYLASTFPKPFMIKTQGEATPRDMMHAPMSIGETDTTKKLWDQLMALLNDPHDYKTLIVDSATGLESLFVSDVIASDPKASNIQTAHGGYGAGRDAVTAMHLRVRKAAELLRVKRGMHVVFVAHANIDRIDPPDSDSYTQYSLRLHQKSMSPYVDQVDLVGFMREETFIKGDTNERKRAIGTGERELVVHMTPTAITKNRFGITEPIPVKIGENPLAQYIGEAPAETPTFKHTPAEQEEPAETEEGMDE